MKKIKNSFQPFIEFKNLENALEYKYIYIRDQPGVIVNYEIIRPNEKYNKNKTDEEKIKAQCLIENIYTGEEIFKGIIKDNELPCLKGEFKEYMLCNLDYKTGDTTLLDFDSNEEIDDIKLDLDSRLEFNKKLIDAFKIYGEITVKVFNFMNSNLIVEFEIDN